jgi:hypothetical protein
MSSLLEALRLQTHIRHAHSFKITYITLPGKISLYRSEKKEADLPDCQKKKKKKCHHRLRLCLSSVRKSTYSQLWYHLRFREYR